MKKIKTLVLSIGLFAGTFGFATVAAVPSFAAINPQEAICDGSGGNGGAGGCSGQTGGNTDNLSNVVKTIVNTLLYIVGVVAVIVIIIGGLRYVTSAGDSSKTAAAKNTILYAVIGLVVAILAYAIVNFVIGAF